MPLDIVFRIIFSKYNKTPQKYYVNLVIIIFAEQDTEVPMQRV